MKLGIYYLYHPVTGEVKYVGRTTSRLNVRLRDHINGAKSLERKYAYRESRVWIRSLLESGIEPGICLIEEVDDSSADFDILEKKWIHYYRSLDYELVNSTNGEKFPWKMCPEQRKEFIIDIVNRINSGISYRQIEKDLELHQGYIKRLRNGSIAAANQLGIAIPETKCRRLADPNKHRPQKKFKPELKQDVVKMSNTRKLQVTELSTGKSITYDSIIEAVQKLDLRRKSVDKCLSGEVKTHKGYTFKRLENATTEQRPIVAISTAGNVIPFNNPGEAVKSLNLRHECIIKCLSGLQDIHKGYRFSFA